MRNLLLIHMRELENIHLPPKALGWAARSSQGPGNEQAPEKKKKEKETHISAVEIFMWGWMAVWCSCLCRRLLGDDLVDFILGRCSRNGPFWRPEVWRTAGCEWLNTHAQDLFGAVSTDLRKKRPHAELKHEGGGVGVGGWAPFQPLYNQIQECGIIGLTSTSVFSWFCERFVSCRATAHCNPEGLWLMMMKLIGANPHPAHPHLQDHVSMRNVHDIPQQEILGNSLAPWHW